MDQGVDGSSPSASTNSAYNQAFHKVSSNSIQIQTVQFTVQSDECLKDAFHRSYHVSVQASWSVLSGVSGQTRKSVSQNINPDEKTLRGTCFPD